MDHRISVDQRMLNNYYERMMDEVYLLYHTYPTTLTHIDLSAAEAAEVGYLDAVGKGLAASRQTGSGSKRKKVMFDSDPNFCNGLPRKR